MFVIKELKEVVLMCLCLSLSRHLRVQSSRKHFALVPVIVVVQKETA